MGFADAYASLEVHFGQHVDTHRLAFRLKAHQEIFVPASFWPRIPAAAGKVDTVFIGMYPSQNWLRAADPKARLSEARAKIASGFRISLSTVWDLIFHLAVREFMCPNGETYYVTDISKGAMERNDEGPTRDWDFWYGLLQNEMAVVLAGNHSKMPRVIPVGRDVDEFLRRSSFGDWLEFNNLGRLTRRITHWAARPPRGWHATDGEIYAERIHELADQLLDEVGAAGWWRQHVKDNLLAVNNPSAESQSQWLMWRYEDEYREILVEELMELPGSVMLDELEDRLWRLQKTGQELVAREEDDNDYDADFYSEEDDDEGDEDDEDEDVSEIGYGLLADLVRDEDDDYE